MSDKKNVVRRWFSLVTQDSGDQPWTEQPDAVMHPNVQWYTIGSTPVSGLHDGLDDLQTTFWPKIRAGEGRPGQGLDPNYNRTIRADEILELEDGRLMVLARADGMGRNGVAYDNEYCFIVTVEDDQITRLVEFCDTALIERAIFNRSIVDQ